MNLFPSLTPASTPPTITSSTAFEIAQKWATYIGAAGSGICLRSLSSDDARPLTEEHREACLGFIIGLLAVVQARSDEADARLTDRAELISLLNYFHEADPIALTTPTKPQSRGAQSWPNP